MSYLGVDDIEGVLYLGAESVGCRCCLSCLVGSDRPLYMHERASCIYCWLLSREYACLFACAYRFTTCHATYAVRARFHMPQG
jgi:hypothetical protein